MPVPPRSVRRTLAPWKLQRLQNRVLRAIGNHDRCTPVRELYMAFKFCYVYEYITKILKMAGFLLKTTAYFDLTGRH
jgi:hypothetical protein